MASFILPLLLLLQVAAAFLTVPSAQQHSFISGSYSSASTALWASSADDEPPQETLAVTINTTLTDDKIKNLFAWIKCAFDFDETDKNDVYAYYYNNMELAIAASFGDNLPNDSLPMKLLEMALKKEDLSIVLYCISRIYGKFEAYNILIYL